MATSMTTVPTVASPADPTLTVRFGVVDEPHAADNPNVRRGFVQNFRTLVRSGELPIRMWLISAAVFPAMYSLMIAMGAQSFIGLALDEVKPVTQADRQRMFELAVAVAAIGSSIVAAVALVLAVLVKTLLVWEELREDVAKTILSLSFLGGICSAMAIGRAILSDVNTDLSVLSTSRAYDCLLFGIIATIFAAMGLVCLLLLGAGVYVAIKSLCNVRLRRR